jgi:hypothetical protein
MTKQVENNGMGRPKGSPNKATAAVREAIAVFAEGNAHKLQEWLDDIAMGVGGNKPDPAKAADLYLRAIEYHIPKLARTEMTGKDGGALEFAGMSDNELDSKIKDALLALNGKV